MTFTLKEFRENPTGKRTSLAERRERGEAHAAAARRILREKNLKAFRDKSGFAVHGRVESKSTPDHFHDVVLSLVVDAKDKTLDNARLGVFSNSPSWVFRYMWVAKDQGFDVPELRSRSPKRALTDKPVKTNPRMEPGWDGVVHPVVKAMELAGWTTSDALTRAAGAASGSMWKDLAKTVASFEEARARENKTKKKK